MVTMGTQPRNRQLPDPTRVGAKLREWREDAGLRREDICYLAGRMVPPSEPRSMEKIRRIEAGEVPTEKLPIVLVTAMIKAAGHDPAELGEWFTTRLAVVRELVGPGSSCSPYTPGRDGFPDSSAA